MIWNRSLFKTRAGRLGLASNVRKNDKVCILYGCTVPVILRDNIKEESKSELEAEEDRVELLKTVIRRAVANRRRKGMYRPTKKFRDSPEWQEMEDARQECLEERRRVKKSTSERDTRGERTKSAKAQKKETERKLAEGVVSAEKKSKEAKTALSAAVSRLQEAKATLEEAKKAAEEKKPQVGTTGGGNTTRPEDKGNPANDAATIDKANKRVEDAETGLSAAQENERKATHDATCSKEEAEEEIKEEIKKEIEKEAEDAAVESASSGGTKSPPATPSVTSTLKDTDVGAPPGGKNFYYKFVGECYLHGMMDGEAMREKFYDDSINEQTFELR